MGLIGYVFQLYEVVVPHAVERELTRPDQNYPSRVYPDTALFRGLRSQMRDPPTEPAPIALFGRGEAAAIALAAALSIELLINDRRPAVFALNAGIQVVTVPGFIVRLRALGLIPDHMARAMLATCAQRGTSPELVDAGEQLLNELHR